MLKYWLSQGSFGVTSSSDDARTLALDVLAYVGFQKSYPWQSTTRRIDSDRPLSYRDSLSIILKNILTIVVLPQAFWNIPFLPASMKQTGRAIRDFKNYMLSQLAYEQSLETSGQATSGTLMGNLVHASAASVPSESKASQLKPLTIDEILGNVFVFNFAGHDTTAISLAFAMTLLVARDDIQDWIAEELNYYLGDSEPDQWQYEAIYPKLKRCLAVLVSSQHPPICFGDLNWRVSSRHCVSTIHSLAYQSTLLPRKCFPLAGIRCRSHLTPLSFQCCRRCIRTLDTGAQIL